MAGSVGEYRSQEDWDQEYREGAHWEKAACPLLVAFAAGLPAESRIFDAGCGSGRDSLFLAEKGFQVTGLDLSPVAIRKARDEALKQGVEVDFITGNLEHLEPFSNNCFDAIYSGYVMPGIDMECVLPQLARVLKPQGVALFVALYETLYDPPCRFDQVVDLNGLETQIRSFFRVAGQQQDSFEEIDQHGFHRHKRAIFHLASRR